MELFCLLDYNTIRVEKVTKEVDGCIPLYQDEQIAISFGFLSIVEYRKGLELCT